MSNSKVIDLFAGAGGLSHGFQRAGFEVIGGIDSEERFKKTFEENHGAPYWTKDIRNISSDDVYSHFGISESTVDVVIGGPPCQGFSLAKASRDPNDSRNQLVAEFVRMVSELEPRWFVMENVTGLANMEEGAVLEYLHSQYEKIGYKCKHRILNSLEFGVPQKRRRVIFVGNRVEGEISYPKGDYQSDNDQKTLAGVDKSFKTPRTVKDAFGDLPSLKPGEKKTSYASEPKCSYQEVMREDSDKLFNHRSPNHTEKVTSRIKKAGPGEKIPYKSWTQKRRLEWDKPSPVLMAGPRPTYHFGHPHDDRGLSVRERARLQSFPDDFVFYGPIAKQRQQTGNAVPPLMAEELAKHIDKLMI